MLFKERCKLNVRTPCGIVALFLLMGWGGTPAPAQTAEFGLVALSTASPTDLVATLPMSVPRFLNDASFVVEVWVQTSHASGLSSASADLAFTSGRASVTGVVHSATYNVLTAGTINNGQGTIDNLSGSHLGPCTDAVAVAPQWARVAVLNVTALASGSLSFQSGPTGSAIYGTAICGVGNLADAQITFGSVSAELVDCLTNGDCDDGQFCNGAETCNLATFTCQPGTPPSCDDGVACTIDGCDPLAGGGGGACIHTPSDALCDNLLFCDGAESCDAVQGCLPGVAPCTLECEHCVEESDSCEWCILDLDANGVMGTGDFSTFAPCFGICHPPASPCLASNFDGDPEGCVGTSDFAAFAGCFGSACGACPGCAGPGGAAVAAEAPGEDGAVVEVRMIPRREAATTDLSDTLPPADSSFAVGEEFRVELWAKLSPGEPAVEMELASAYADVVFDRQRVRVVDVVASEAFSLLTRPQGALTHPGVVAAGGCASLGGFGAGRGGKWVRVSSVLLRAVSAGQASFSAGPSDRLHGFAQLGAFRNIDPAGIEFRPLNVQIVKDRRSRNRG